MASRISALRTWQLRVSDRTSWSILTLTTNDDLTGFGEFSDAGDHLLAAQWVDSVRGVVCGWDPDDGVDRLQQALFPLCHNFDRRQWLRQRTAAGAIIAAACDILAQRDGESLGTWLGGRVVRSVPLYANINRSVGRRRPEDFARVARAAVAAGFRTVKVAPFDGPTPPDTGVLEDGLAIVGAVREAVGADVALLVDVHQKLSEADVVAAITPLEELGVGWLEDAVDARDLGALRRLAQRTSIPLAGGELLLDADEFTRVADSGLLEYLLLDPKYVGGPIRTREILRRVDGALVTFHNPVGPVATALSGHLSTLGAHPLLVEYPFGEAIDREALTDGRESVVGGRLVLPTAAGLGVTMPRDGSAVG